MEVYNPLNLAELTACLPLFKPGAIISGGCTDLSVRYLKASLPGQLLNVSLVSELRKINTEAGYLRIGAAATFTELEEYAAPAGFEALKQMAAGVGSKQIRNAATVGGNIMNASPAGDLAPCLFLLGAGIEFMKPNGSVCCRSIEETVTGAGKTSLEYNEVLTAVKIPIPNTNGWHTAFLKLGFRKNVTAARINIAVSARAVGGNADEARFYMGAVAPVPVRIYEAEKILLENEWNAKTCDKLAAYLSDWLKRTVPAEFDRDYKAYAIKGAVYDLLRMFPFFKGAVS